MDDVKNIAELLFHFTPKTRIENGTHYRILLRRSLARYLYQECCYPIGKKSVVNLPIPSWIMESGFETKISFVKGFLNAEASVRDDSIKIRQTVRIFPPENFVAQLRQVAKNRVARNYSYYSLNWRAGKHLCRPYFRPSNILLDLQKLLGEFQVKGKIYPYWIWISQINNNVSIHHELYLSKRPAERLINLISL